MSIAIHDTLTVQRQLSTVIHLNRSTRNPLTDKQLQLLRTIAASYVVK